VKAILSSEKKKIFFFFWISSKCGSKLRGTFFSGFLPLYRRRREGKSLKKFQKFFEERGGGGK
jgi:hypothetical protein